MQGPLTTQSPEQKIAESRWLSRRDLSQWIKAFSTYFPRRTHIAERVATRLSGATSYETLIESMPDDASPDMQIEMHDAVFAKRRMVRFKEDRLILVLEFRILPDAADLFLWLCPVGSRDCMYDGVRSALFDASLCYYQDDQAPSEQIEAIVEEQRQLALGQRLATVDSTQRLGYYPHPEVIFNLFHFLGWNYNPDLHGCEKIDPHVSVARVGWITDAELGSVECFALRFTAYPVWGRDEIFWSVLAELKRTRNLTKRPVLILNNRPQQLVRDGHSYTAVGWVVMDAKVVPWFVSHKRRMLSDTLVDLITFDPATASTLADDGNIALSVFWELLRNTAITALPHYPRFKSMPDNWMIIYAA